MNPPLKKNYLVFLVILASLFISGCSDLSVDQNSNIQLQPLVNNSQQTLPSSEQKEIYNTTTSVPDVSPSLDSTVAPNGTYENVDGEQVPRPYTAPSAPAGATAKCRDGTYSFSQHRSGTCSHHGGVAQWL